MAKKVIISGTYDWDPVAEKVRLSMDKINDNFTELYNHKDQNPPNLVKPAALQTFKAPGNDPNNPNLEGGDFVIGFWNATLIWDPAIYISGPEGDAASYNVLNSYDLT